MAHYSKYTIFLNQVLVHGNVIIFKNARILAGIVVLWV